MHGFPENDTRRRKCANDGRMVKEAEACPLKEIRGFAKYIRKDRNAVEQTCRTAFNNGLLEGTVNKAKAFKRNMFNKAGPAVLRAKLLYAD